MSRSDSVPEALRDRPDPMQGSTPPRGNVRTQKTEAIVADINVIFPKKGNACVIHEADVLPRGAIVTWCFHSDNPKIETVEVEFDDPSATFFPNAPNPTKFSKKLEHGEADFYGHVPNYGRLSNPMIAKYTVRGLDKKGKEIVSQDPVIVTPQP